MKFIFLVSVKIYEHRNIDLLPEKIQHLDV